MIAIVFLLGLLAVTIFARRPGAGSAVTRSDADGIFVVFFVRRVHAAVLGVLGVLTGLLFGPPVVAVLGNAVGALLNYVCSAVRFLLWASSAAPGCRTGCTAR